MSSAPAPSGPNREYALLRAAPARGRLTRAAIRAVGNPHRDKVKIRTLEKTLEDEKRRLATMEMELRDAKKQREADLQLTTMRKQNKSLTSMMATLATSQRREHAERLEWEEEWRQKIDDLHKQHRDMEEALKRRHFQEIQALQEQIKNGVRKVATEMSKSSGRRMPSPRSLKHMQDTNMESLVMLFHRHGQERTHLASKLAQQEELLVRSKNAALQRRMAATQGSANGLFKKYSLPTVRTPGVAPGSPASRQLSLTAGADTQPLWASLPGGSAPQSAGGPRGATRESRRGPGAIRREALPSPRMDGTSTFLTEIAAPDEDAYAARAGRRQRDAARTAGRGTPGSASASERGGEPASRGEDAGAAGEGLLAPPTTAAVWGEAGAPGAPRAGDHRPAEEFEGWSRPTLRMSAGGGAGWDASAAGRAGPPLHSTWHPNVIAFESSAAAHRRASQDAASPYLAPLSAPGRARRAPRGRAGGALSALPSTRSSMHSRASAGAASARAAAGGARSQAERRSPVRSPVGAAAPAARAGGAGAGAGASMGAGAGAGVGAGGGAKVVRGRELPSLGAAGIQTGRGQPTDHNYNRPLTTLGVRARARALRHAPATRPFDPSLFRFPSRPPVSLLPPRRRARG
jgi:Skp family chaperone for outer membrane proteins